MSRNNNKKELYVKLNLKYCLVCMATKSLRYYLFAVFLYVGVLANINNIVIKGQVTFSLFQRLDISQKVIQYLLNTYCVMTFFFFRFLLDEVVEWLIVVVLCVYILFFLLLILYLF